MGQLQGRTAKGQVGVDRKGVHEDFAQKAIGQMPEIVRPNAFEGGALAQLAEAGVNASMRRRERFAPAWRPEVAVTTDHATRPCGEIFGGSPFLAIAWRHLDLAENTGPTATGVPPKALERLLRHVVMPIGGLIPEPTAAWGAGKRADR